MSAIELKYPHIRELREELELSQEDMADYLNVSQVAYSYYEIGRRDIPPNVLIEISNRFGCSIDYLLGCTNNKKRV